MHLPAHPGLPGSGGRWPLGKREPHLLSLTELQLSLSLLCVPPSLAPPCLCKALLSYSCTPPPLQPFACSDLPFCLSLAFLGEGRIGPGALRPREKAGGRGSSLLVESGYTADPSEATVSGWRRLGKDMRPGLAHMYVCVCVCHTRMQGMVSAPGLEATHPAFCVCVLCKTSTVPQVLRCFLFLGFSPWSRQMWLPLVLDSELTSNLRSWGWWWRVWVGGCSQIHSC